MNLKSLLRNRAKALLSQEAHTALPDAKRPGRNRQETWETPVPPALPVFVEAYLKQPPLSARQQAAVEAFCGLGPESVFDKGRKHTIAVLLWGKGSGKDWLCSVLVAWFAYIVCCLSDPWVYFEQAEGEMLDIINVASTAVQARRVFFTKLKRHIRQPCFEPFAPRIGGDEIVFHRTGGGADTKDGFLRLVSYHSQNESYEGFNILIWLMDEASAFHEKDSQHSNAERVFSTLKSSATSRFGAQSLGFILSYPREEEDFTLRMYEAGEDDPTIYRDRGATWDIHPRRTREDFDADFRRNPEDARTKYECLPPASIDAFFTFPDKIDACIDPLREPAVTGQPVIVQRGSQGYVGLQLSPLPPVAPGAYFMHLDTGLTDDHCVLCLCHRDTSTAVCRGLDSDLADGYGGDVLKDKLGLPVPGIPVQYRKWRTPEVIVETVTDAEGKHKVTVPPGLYEYTYLTAPGPVTKSVTAEAGLELTADGHTQRVCRVVEDALLEWEPDKQNQIPVDFLNVSEVVLALARHFRVTKVTFDKWNSESMVQSLLEAGFDAESLQFSNTEQLQMYQNLKTLLYNDLASLLLHDLGRRELRRVQLIKGIKIDHREGESKDTSDARAAAFWQASQDNGGGGSFLLLG